MIKKTENSQPTKKAKLYYSPSILSKKATHSGDETSLQMKIIKKNSAGFELVNQTKEWRKYCEREFEQHELVKLSPKVLVMQNIQKHYAKKIEKLLYKEYSYLLLLLCIFHEELGRYTGAKYYRMMNKKSIKFCNKVITIWFEKIKS